MRTMRPAAASAGGSAAHTATRPRCRTAALGQDQLAATIPQQWQQRAVFHSSRGSRGSRRRIARCRAIPQASLLLPQPLGLAAKAAALVPGLAGAIDPGVLAATVSASGKLFIICSAVGWLLKTGRIPNSTATVMSQARAGSCQLPAPLCARWLVRLFAGLRDKQAMRPCLPASCLLTP